MALPVIKRPQNETLFIKGLEPFPSQKPTHQEAFPTYHGKDDWSPIVKLDAGHAKSGYDLQSCH